MLQRAGADVRLQLVAGQLETESLEERRQNRQLEVQ